MTTTPSLSDAARADLAPNGRLRAGINLANGLLVSTRVPEPAGVAPELARELARRAGATLELVGYANAGLVADAGGRDDWDVAFIADEPARATDITFTRAYVEIEATFAVPDASSIRTIVDVDRPGVRVASVARAAYTLYLQRTLRHATVTEVTGPASTPGGFQAAGFDALASLKPWLERDVPGVAGVRMLEGRFTAVQQSMAIRKSRRAGAAYLSAFVDEITRSGLLQGLIERYGAHGLLVVP